MSDWGSTGFGQRFLTVVPDNLHRISEELTKFNALKKEELLLKKFELGLLSKDEYESISKGNDLLRPQSHK